MSRIFKILVPIFCTLFFVSLWAQKKVATPKKIVQKKTDTVKTEANFRKFMPGVYLGNSEFTGGRIRKKYFDSLMRKGIASHDSLGNNYKVIGFNFTYAERNIYEDSLANLIVMTDYIYEYCPGDTVSAGIAESLYQRTKSGDTIFIEKVKVVKQIKETNEYMPDSTAVLAKSMKCILVK